MRLSRKLGRTYAELMEVMTEDELIRQLAMEEYEPLVDSHLQLGILLETLGACHGSKRFDPYLWHPGRKMTKEQSTEELEEIIRGL